MANHASAKKRIRQTETRTARNRHVRSTVRTYIKRARLAIASGDSKAAQDALREAESKIRVAVSKGVFHHKTGSRYVSRLSIAVNGVAAKAA
ncbi:MAG: 30S ribosomal protein S20 [Polyangiales bacterium]